ncbi:MAG: low molecular weight protein arginine phosphatase [Alkaliphilus sp.]
MKTILFVCTGNTCRSSMAEGMFKNLCKSVNNLKIISAGILAISGSVATSKSIEVMKERGVCLLDHTATMLTRELISESDLVLTMTSVHKDAIASIVNDAKVFTLKEYVTIGAEQFCHIIKNSARDKIAPSLLSRADDILDPFGQEIYVYRKTADEIEECLKILCEVITKEKIEE